MRAYVFLLISSLFWMKPVVAQDTTKMFIFGHSLIDHRPPAIPTPSDETTVPHWLFLMAQEAGHPFAAGGQYGFLPQHANLPPISQWGYEIVPGVWDSDNESFSDAEIDLAMITAGNFMQWQGPGEEYPGENGVSPISATQDIVDWLDTQEPGIRIYIYENWPDMAPYLDNGFPPTSLEWDLYTDYWLSDFYDWWIEYHDAMDDSRPNLDIKMIPVGQVMAMVLTETELMDIPIDELFEDDAPHGQSTIYFLAAMITYSAIFDEQAPADFVIPGIVHPVVRRNYDLLRSLIWEELNDFKFDDGRSRVFDRTTTSVSVDTETQMEVRPNPSNGTFKLITQQTGPLHVALFDCKGNTVETFFTSEREFHVSVSPGVYFLKVSNKEKGQIGLETVIISQ